MKVRCRCRTQQVRAGTTSLRGFFVALSQRRRQRAGGNHGRLHGETTAGIDSSLWRGLVWDGLEDGVGVRKVGGEEMRWDRIGSWGMGKEKGKEVCV